MELQTKYQRLITAVREKDNNVQINEQENILYIDGKVGTEQEKDALWDIYNELDPDYRVGDVRLNLSTGNEGSEEVYEVRSGDSLSKIGSRYGVAWKDIYEANRDQIKNPDLIQPG
ncbi:MAG: LysM peptidoglycan-binding domain-containing protein, partial [Gemmatimonadaceae bacterium]|nr:LysM peptidoglycan-binding domain-containing protein [Chitinophagaceae bacterium]